MAGYYRRPWPRLNINRPKYIRVLSAYRATLAETSATSDSFAGGAIYPISLSDTAATSDAYTVAPIYPTSLSDTAATSDSFAGLMTVVVSLTDTAATSDSFAGTMTVVVSLTETAVTSDVYIRNSNVAETAATSDSFTAGLVFATSTLTETVATSDAFTSTVTYPVTLSDTAATSELYANDFFTQALLDWNFAGNAYRGLPLTALAVTRATAGTAPNAAGVYTQFSAGQPRLLDTGLWVEETRTNLIGNNTATGAALGQIGSGGSYGNLWANGVVTNATMTVAGIGTENGVEYIDITIASTSTTGGSRIQFDQPTFGTSLPFAHTAFMKVVSGDFSAFATFALRVIDVPSSSTVATTNLISTLTSTLSRVIQSGTSSGTATNLRPEINWTNQAVGSVTLRIGWGQLEQLTAATLTASTPIRTTNGPATRDTDVPTIGGTNFASVYNQPEGTIFVESVPLAANATTRRMAEVNDGSTSKRMFIAQSTSPGQGRALVQDTTSQVDLLQGTTTAGAVNRLALAYKQDDFAFCVNNSTVATDTVGTVPSPNQLSIGIDNAGTASSALGGPVRRITISGTRVSNTTLGQITAPTNATFPNTLTESNATSDTLTSLATFPKTLTETAATSDSFVGAATFPNTLTETVATSDSFAATGTLPATLTESATTTDAFTSVAPQSLQEIVTTGDSLTTTVTFASTLTELCATSDRFNVVQPVTLTESNATSDAYTSIAAFVSTRTETVATSETYAGTATINAALTETCTTFDVFSTTAFVFDVASTSDAFVPGVISTQALSDTAATSDSLTTTQTFVNNSRTESVATSDSFAATATLPNSLADTIATSETYTTTGTTYPVTLAESCTTSDAYTAPIPTLFSTETAATSDSFVRTYTAGATRVETVATSDAYTTRLTTINARLEQALTGDSFASASVYTRTLIETAITGELYTGGGGGPIIPIEGSIEPNAPLIGSADATTLIGSTEDLELEGSIG